MSSEESQEESDGVNPKTSARTVETEKSESKDARKDGVDRGTTIEQLYGPQSAVSRSSQTSPRDPPSGARTPGRSKPFVPHDPGTRAEIQRQRYGLDIRERDHSERIQRLEDDHGRERVQRWAEEGMPVETMGKPRDMTAFRERQDARDEAVPEDIERRNRMSVQRNTGGGGAEKQAGETGTPGSVRDVVSSPGRSMDDDVQGDMESKMGRSLDHVRIHTGKKAARAANSIDARAFTVGNHIAFNDGEYEPDTKEGKKTLAHEITHTFQQTGGKLSMLPQADAARTIVQRSEAPPSSSPGGEVISHKGKSMHVQPRLEVSSPDDPAEKEARKVAEQVVERDDDSETDTESGTEGSQRVRTLPEQSITLTPAVGQSPASLPLQRMAAVSQPDSAHERAARNVGERVASGLSVASHIDNMPAGNPAAIQRDEAGSGGSVQSLSSSQAMQGQDLMSWAENMGTQLDKLAPEPGDMVKGKFAVKIPIKLALGGTITIKYDYTAEKKVEEGDEEGHELNMQGKATLAGSLGVGYAKTLDIGLSAGLGLKSALTVQAANGVDAMEQLLTLVYEALKDVIKGIKTGIPMAAQTVKNMYKKVLLNWGRAADDILNGMIPDWIQEAANREFAIAYHLDNWLESFWTGIDKGPLSKLSNLFDKYSGVLKEAAEYCWNKSKRFVPLADQLEWAVDPVGLTKSAIDQVQNFTQGLADLEDEGVKGLIDELTSVIGNTAEYYVNKIFGGGRPEPLTEWGADEFVQGSLGVNRTATASAFAAEAKGKLSATTGLRIGGDKDIESYVKGSGNVKVQVGVPNASGTLNGGFAVRHWINSDKDTTAKVYGGYEQTAPGSGNYVQVVVKMIGGAAKSLAQIIEKHGDQLPGESSLHEQIKTDLNKAGAVANAATEPADIQTQEGQPLNDFAVKGTVQFTDGDDPEFDKLTISVMFGTKVVVPAGVVEMEATKGRVMKFTYDGSTWKKLP